MGIPQILMIVIFTLRIIGAIASHGEVTADFRRRNAFYDVLAEAIIISILYSGGFWSQ